MSRHTRPFPDNLALLGARLAATTPARIQEPGSLETAVSVMLAPGKAGLQVLLIQRAERPGDPWSGHMGLPGGRREPGDADRLATAIRETHEEIGVALAPESLLGCLDDLHPRTPSLPQVCIRPFVFGLPDPPRASNSPEVAASFWVPLNALAAARGSSPVTILGSPVQVPCYTLEELPKGKVVWGLTYRILDSLLSL